MSMPSESKVPNELNAPRELLYEDRQLDPYPSYERMRETDPVHFDSERDVWDLYRYADVKYVLSNADSFERHVAAVSSIADEVDLPGFGTEFITVDPEEHPVFIKAVGKDFSRAALSEREETLEDLVAKYLDEAIDDGRIDYKAGFASPFPIAVIGDIIGISSSDIDRFAAWAEGLRISPDEFSESGVAAAPDEH